LPFCKQPKLRYRANEGDSALAQESKDPFGIIALYVTFGDQVVQKGTLVLRQRSLFARR
jgi:hypothetical protein